MIYASIVALCILNLLTLVVDHAGDLPKKWKRVVLVGLVLMNIVVTALGVSMEWQRRQDERQARREQSGMLFSERKSEEKLPTLRIGEGRLQPTTPMASPAFMFGNTPIYIGMNEGRAELTTEVRDKQGFVLAKIEKNRWKIDGKNLEDDGYDYNYKNDMLEIVDENGDPFFQVYIDGADMHIAGKFYDLNGRSGTLGPWVHEHLIKYRRLFKYPSKDHPGELADY